MNKNIISSLQKPKHNSFTISNVQTLKLSNQCTTLSTIIFIIFALSIIKLAVYEFC